MDRKIWCCLAGWLLLLLPVGERDTTLANDGFVRTMQTQIPVLMNRYDVPGLIIALLQDGRVVWTDAFGYADLDSGREMTTATLCRVESLSKPVTAAGVMKLAGRGIIDLDAPVRSYLRSWEFPASLYPDPGLHLPGTGGGGLVFHRGGLCTLPDRVYARICRR